jgi:hypothetical protein
MAARLEDENDESITGQKERFAVAAIGFCLVHDPTFRSHYFGALLCDIPEAKGMSRDVSQLKVQIEPHTWADLLVEDERSVLVVEHKITAELAPHQDPWKKSFFEYAKGAPPGYGAEMKTHFPSKQLFYVALGKEFEKKDEDGVFCWSKSWERLIGYGRAETPLERDLLDCIGRLGVANLRLRHVMNKIINKNLIEDAEPAARMVVVLKSVCESVGLKSARISEKDVDYSEDYFCFGLTIREGRSDSSETTQGRLAKLVAADSADIGWFGYEKTLKPDWERKAGEEGAATCVVLYCGNELAKLNTIEKVKNLDPRGSTESGSFGVRVVKPANSAQGDREWFVEVLNKLAN